MDTVNVTVKKQQQTNKNRGAMVKIAKNGENRDPHRYTRRVKEAIQIRQSTSSPDED